MFSRFPSNTRSSGCLVVAACLLWALGGCEREKRDTHPDKSSQAG
jgi:hypothetical protein